MNDEVKDASDVSALARVPEQRLAERPAEAGIARLARLSEDQFTSHLALLRTGYSRLKRVQRELMTPGVHWGMPGAKPDQLAKLAAEGKVGLYKAGAELLCQLLGFVSGRPDLRIEYGDPDNETSPSIVVHASVPIHRGEADGPVVGVGVGAWSTWEVKNRYREQKRTCPACGKAALLFQQTAKGGEFRGRSAFWCAPSRDGCSANFSGDDPRITEQQTGREVNRDAADLLNTGVKMATKRAFVDGTIRASGSSDLFTQDVEDMSPEQVKRRESEVSAGADATTAAMYGDGGPDDWRDAVHGEPAKPAAPQAIGNAPSSPASPSAARSATEAPSGQQGEPEATDKQRGAVRGLLRSKLGAESHEDADVALKTRLHLPGGWDRLTKKEASTVIAALNAMPDLPKTGPAAAALRCFKDRGETGDSSKKRRSD